MIKTAAPVPMLTAGLFAAGMVALVLHPAGLAPAQQRIAILVLGTIGLWASGLLAESVTALLFFTVAMLAKIAPPEVVFAGLMSSAFWLILSGLVLGAAIRHSGLGDRVAALLAARLDGGWRGAMTGVVLFGLAMAFIMPSAMGRIALMLPILAALAERLGYGRGGRAHTGLVLGGVFATYLPSSAILPANVPNNVMAGIAETALGHPLSFGHYLLLHFPVLGAAKALLLLAVLLVLYRAPAPRMAADRRPVRAPVSPAERRLAVVLAVALGLWATDSLHHFSPAWVGLAAAVVCLLPPLRVLPPKALQTINFEPVFYVAGVISLGALVVHAGLGEHLAQWALHLLAPGQGQPVAGFLRLCGLATGIGLLTTLPGIPAVLTPLTDALAAGTGLSPTAVLAAQVVGFSTLVLPYQAPPLVMAMQVAELPRRDMTRLSLVTAAATILLLWPLDIAWLSLLGQL